MHVALCFSYTMMDWRINLYGVTGDSKGKLKHGALVSSLVRTHINVDGSASSSVKEIKLASPHLP